MLCSRQSFLRNNKKLKNKEKKINENIFKKDNNFDNNKKSNQENNLKVFYINLNY